MQEPLASLAAAAADAPEATAEFLAPKKARGTKVQTLEKKLAAVTTQPTVAEWGPWCERTWAVQMSRIAFTGTLSTRHCPSSFAWNRCQQWMTGELFEDALLLI